MSIKKSPLAIAVGTTLFSGLATTSVQAEGFENAGNNPFAMTELASGYMLVAKADKDGDVAKKMKDGNCGEGKCGAGMMEKADLEKTAEGKCAGNMPKAKKPDMKDMEGKCGEGKCGDSMK
ncbi:hypothetical protein BJAS_P1244 [Bathymodiolus japonicus methanotrophic gill symbiont]|uniref:HvfA family oxazolone/thioamide-modified RiPP metallophore n=1 Tax=Bathymodiolus japonicus methanotrophic gill symbiont TaxID=113269 RepID=UPI001B595E18|nr:hypothetical protein [Bathymodiolus japonicus methanotrophic gill symbiont]GFO71616.1 hypothetical protein BJAS_P1244 [Bathymodiolus japonicus methanotrophic gill symbiont]